VGASTPEMSALFTAKGRVSERISETKVQSEARPPVAVVPASVSQPEVVEEAPRTDATSGAAEETDDTLAARLRRAREGRQ